MLDEDDQAFLQTSRSEFEPESGPDWRANYQRLVDILKERRVLVLRDLHEEIKDEIQIRSYTDFTTRIGDLPPEKCRVVVAYIYRNRLPSRATYGKTSAPKGGADLLYHAVIDFLGIREETLLNAPHYLVGTYQLWRQSNSVPGDFVYGALRISRKDGTPTLIAQMDQFYRPTGDTERQHLAARHELYRGYIFRQPGGRCILFLGDKSRRSFRVTFFSNVALTPTRVREPEKIFSMRGMVMGIDDAKNFVTPIYVERISDLTDPTKDPAIRKLLDSANIVDKYETPRKVLRVLEGMPLMSF